MLIDRTIAGTIKAKIAGEPRVFVVYGPRQSGKTVLLNSLLENEKRKTLFLRGEDVQVQEVFSLPIFDKIANFISDCELLVIDEAQKIENIGQSLKLLFDTRPMTILVSGSASFDLANKLAEPMTGRATFFTLYPLAVSELPRTSPNFGLTNKLEGLMRFGMYPKVHTLITDKEKEEYLYDVINTYLYNDLLTFKEIKKPKKILDLLGLLAHQIGNEVNIHELSQNLLLDWQTVEKYLDVLEKMFIVVNLRGLSRNLRKEISKTSKYYFMDLGLRNAVIRNFNPVNLRGDVGPMFENFCVIERMKSLANKRESANWYFWRTYDQKEIDLVEERGGKLKAFEFKYTKTKSRGSAAREFMTTYENSSFLQINNDNLESFLS